MVEAAACAVNKVQAEQMERTLLFTPSLALPLGAGGGNGGGRCSGRQQSAGATNGKDFIVYPLPSPPPRGRGREWWRPLPGQLTRCRRNEWKGLYCLPPP